MAVTRPEKDFAEVAEALGKTGAVPVSVPAIVIDYSPNAELTNALARVGEFDWAIFTSKNVVEAVFRTTDAISGPRVAAVGPSTAAAWVCRSPCGCTRFSIPAFAASRLTACRT